MIVNLPKRQIVHCLRGKYAEVSYLMDYINTGSQLLLQVEGFFEKMTD